MKMSLCRGTQMYHVVQKPNNQPPNQPNKQPIDQTTSQTNKQKLISKTDTTNWKQDEQSIKVTKKLNTQIHV